MAEEADDKNPVSLRYAGFWIRFGARFIDFLVYTPVFLLVIYVQNTSLKIYGYFIFASTSVIALYQIYFIGRWGATLGKMATHIKVVDVKGQSIGYRKAFLRYVVDLAFYLATCVCIWTA